MIQHSKGEKCGKDDCEHCSKINTNQSDVDLEELYKKLSTSINSIYDETVHKLKGIFEKKIKLNNIFDEMYMEPNDLENNDLDVHIYIFHINSLNLTTYIFCLMKQIL